MKKCKITVMKIASYPDLSAEYELPQDAPCDMEPGLTFITDGTAQPEGLCDSAWETLAPFVQTLAAGGSKIYGDWMKNPASAMVSCNDGFRPVSFYIEVLE